MANGNISMGSSLKFYNDLLEHYFVPIHIYIWITYIYASSNGLEN
jgi:hypothetical protein